MKSLFALALFIAPLLSAHAIDAGRSLYIEGYPGQISYAPGEVAEFHISTTSPTYSIEIKRLGGETKIVHKESKIEGGLEYSIPETASSKGCNWPVGHRVTIGEDWASGYYVMTMRIADSGGKYTQWNRRSAESQCYFCGAPEGARQELENPAAAGDEYLQCLQQLGRVESIRLPRPGRPAGARGIVSSTAAELVFAVGARLCKVGGNKRLHAGFLLEHGPAAAPRNCEAVSVGTQCRTR